MGAPAVQLVEARGLTEFQAEVASLLDEQHLCAWSGCGLDRCRFVAELGAGLARLSETRVAVLRGAAITDLYSFCAQLEIALGVERLRRSIDGQRGVIDALRRPAAHSNGKALKRRFIVWDDAHELLRADHVLFGQLADAIAGTSAELEYVIDDALLLQRAVFVGTPALDVYAEDPRGQFSRWYCGPSEEPRWRRVTWREGPSVGRFEIPPPGRW